MRFKLHSVGDISVIEITVRALDATSRVDELGKELFELVDRRGHKKIIVDLSNVQFLASAAMGVMVTLRHKIEYHKGRLAICGLPGQLHQVFKFAKLDTVFTFYDTRDEALAAFAPPAAE